MDSWRFIYYYFCLCSAAGAGLNAGEEEEALPTYKDAFPPLPEKAASPEGTQETANAWTSKIRPLKSSVITQVEFHYFHENISLHLALNTQLVFKTARAASGTFPRAEKPFEELQVPGSKWSSGDILTLKKALVGG